MALYREVYRVKINHNYYTSGVSGDFSIRPTAVCQEMLLKQGMLFKVVQNDLVVLAEAVADGSDYVMKRPIPEGAKFTFMMVNNTSTFLNYTHLPLKDNLNKVYYFSNLNDHQDGGDLLLYPSNAGHFVSEDERITLFPDVFTMEFAVATQVKITDAYSGSVVFDASVTGIQEFDFSGDKSHKRYHVEFNDSGNVDMVFYVDGMLVSQQRLFGIIEVYKSSTVPAAYRFINASTQLIQQKTYTIRFNRRTSAWRYVVEIKYNDTLMEEYDEHTLDLGISFTGEDFTQTPPYVSVLPRIVKFESDEQIPFHSTPTSGIKLETNFSTTPVTVKNNIPNPSTDMVIPAADYEHGSPTHDLVYSEIFIYV